MLLLGSIAGCDNHKQQSQQAQEPPQADIVSHDPHINDNFDQYRQEIGKLSSVELIASLESLIVSQEASAKRLASYLADNDMDAAESAIEELSEEMRMQNYLMKVILLRQLAGEFSPDEYKRISDILFASEESVKNVAKIIELAIQMPEE